ncbi:MAG: hypothetical protein Q4G36_09625 [Paracoccus sp. (in: a-proteobacteria)]|nr:hypothetical protein [Paracoccus sp. (in: a-proteobacteria)]
MSGIHLVAYLAAAAAVALVTILIEACLKQWTFCSTLLCLGIGITVILTSILDHYSLSDKRPSCAPGLTSAPK